MTETSENQPATGFEQTEASVERLIRDLRVVLQDADTLIRATSGEVSEKTRESRAKLAGAISVARETAARLEEKLAEPIRTLDTAIRQNPYTGVGGALIVGVLAGLVVEAISSRKS